MTNQELLEYLQVISEHLSDNGYVKKVKALLPNLKTDEKEKIIAAMERITAVLNEEKVYVKAAHERKKRAESFSKMKDDDYLNRKEAIVQTNLPISTFDRKVRKDIREYNADGKPVYRVDKLRKIMRIIIDSSPSALCLNETNEFNMFEYGQYYKIIEKNEKHVYIYSDKDDYIFRLSVKEYENFFKFFNV